MSEIGHNGGPKLNDQRTTIRTRWAKALFADPTTPPYVMAIAWAVHWFSTPEGRGAALSNEQLKCICGISERTATRGKAWLRDEGYVQLTVGSGDEKTRFQMALPTVSDALRVATQSTLAVQAEQVADRLTVQGSHTGKGSQPDGAATQATQTSHTVHPRVATQATSIQERDSRPIQDKKGGRPSEAKNLWQEALNPHADDVVLIDGKPTLLNGQRVHWLELFGGNEQRLDLALVQIAPYVQQNNNRPLQAQVASQLARIIGGKMDREQKKPQESTSGRFRRIFDGVIAAKSGDKP